MCAGDPRGGLYGASEEGGERPAKGEHTAEGRLSPCRTTRTEEFSAHMLHHVDLLTELFVGVIVLEAGVYSPESWRSSSFVFVFWLEGPGAPVGVSQSQSEGEADGLKTDKRSRGQRAARGSTSPLQLRLCSGTFPLLRGGCTVQTRAESKLERRAPRPKLKVKGVFPPRRLA
ncbi:hypothetical protein EYF80_042896 [Liparis tanakae]|uniref:Uncharacterized protein n=1 Tax=Liparis tanakae TaxID=230148 RepID=A0A4Z2G1C0_9TELE|nr:hypothetical protein EYF80_042896 [Liparis tanakae]